MILKRKDDFPPNVSRSFRDYLRLHGRIKTEGIFIGQQGLESNENWGMTHCPNWIGNIRIGGSSKPIGNFSENPAAQFMLTEFMQALKWSDPEGPPPEQEGI